MSHKAETFYEDREALQQLSTEATTADEWAILDEYKSELKGVELSKEQDYASLADTLARQENERRRGNDWTDTGEK